MSFTHLSIIGQLNHLDILGIVNNAARNTECKYLVKILDYNPLDKYPELGLLDNMQVLVFNYLRNLHAPFH